MRVHRTRAYYKTTQSHRCFWCHANILKEGIDQERAHRPEQIWEADITDLPVSYVEAYLSLVTDAYSRKIVGYHVYGDLKVDSVVLAYQKELRGYLGSTWPIHHSDRGIQYCSKRYQVVHEKHGVPCS